MHAKAKDALEEHRARHAEETDALIHAPGATSARTLAGG